MARSLSALRPTAKGLRSRLILRSEPFCTNTSMGNMPEPGSAPGPVMVEKPMAHPRPTFGWSSVGLPALDEDRPEPQRGSLPRASKQCKPQKSPESSRERGVPGGWVGERGALPATRNTPLPGRTNHDMQSSALRGLWPLTGPWGAPTWCGACSNAGFLAVVARLLAPGVFPTYVLNNRLFERCEEDLGQYGEGFHGRNIATELELRSRLVRMARVKGRRALSCRSEARARQNEASDSGARWKRYALQVVWSIQRRKCGQSIEHGCECNENGRSPEHDRVFEDSADGSPEKVDTKGFG